jgi:5-hydroxyisourate hydrolase
MVRAMMISARILDTAHGRPGSRISTELDVLITGKGWHEVGHGVSNEEGHIHDFGEPAAPGVYRLMFDVAAYMPHAFFPSVPVTFEVREPGERYRINVLLSAWGYTVFLDDPQR